jgi:hypothetical protein
MLLSHECFKKQGAKIVSNTVTRPVFGVKSTLSRTIVVKYRSLRFMEDWELDFEWLRVKHYVKDAMKRDDLPDLNMVLLLIGIQELGRWKKKFNKEEKQDLMHIAVCRLLSYEDYFEFVGRDADGWPHWKQVREMNTQNLGQQERLLQQMAVRYFKELEAE